MKFLLVFTVLISVIIVNAFPVHDDDSNAIVTRYENDNIGVDGYKFAFETSNGIKREEQAQLKEIGGEEPALQVHGSVTWVAADGQTYTLNYVADENGYQPSADFLPK